MWAVHEECHHLRGVRGSSLYTTYSDTQPTTQPIQHTTRHTTHTTHNTAHNTCNTEHSTRYMQHTTHAHTTQHRTHTTRNTCNTQHSTQHMQHTTQHKKGAHNKIIHITYYTYTTYIYNTQQHTTDIYIIHIRQYLHMVQSTSKVYFIFYTHETHNYTNLKTHTTKTNHESELKLTL